MGNMTTLTAADGHVLGAYQAGMDNVAGLVVIQEIFGVNSHIQTVCERFAAQGFAVIAPALFDRVEPGVQLDYTQATIQTGLALRARISEAATLADISAAADVFSGKPTGIVGYCWGGTLAWNAATQTKRFQAAVGWYGGGIHAVRHRRPQCATQLHFGATDASIPLADVDAICVAQPDVEIFTYPDAGHGFGCDQRSSYHAPSYRQAQARTLAFLTTNLNR